MNSICLHALAILNNSLESDYGKVLYAQCKIDVETIFDRLKGAIWYVKNPCQRQERCTY